MVIEISLSQRKMKTSKYSDKIAVVDDCDADLLEFNWGFRPRHDKRGGYAQRLIRANGKYHYIHMHMVIAERIFPEIPEGYRVDHIDGDGCNNQRYNLRLATPGQNNANRRKFKETVTGLKGVSLTKSGKYTATITKDKVAYRMGPFRTKEEAYQAYCAKAQELYKGFAHDGVNPIGNELIPMPENRPHLEMTLKPDTKTGYQWISIIYEGLPNEGFIVSINIRKKRMYFGFRKTLKDAVELLEESIARINSGEISF